MLRSAKDGLKLKIQGVYRIQYEGEKLYVGQSRKTVEKRCKEYQRYISLHQTEKSAVAKHCNSTVYCMNISSASYYPEHQDTWIALQRKQMKYA
jgi:hypothetical protein